MVNNNINKFDLIKNIDFSYNNRQEFIYLQQPLARCNALQRAVTPGVWIVSQGLTLIKQYHELLDKECSKVTGRVPYSEKYVMLIENFVILSSKLALLKEYRIDTRNIKEENEIYVNEKIKKYKNKNILILKEDMNLGIEWINEFNKKKFEIYQNLEDDIQRYIYETTYDWDCYEIKLDEDLCLSIFDLAPKCGINLSEIKKALNYLNQLWRYPVRTAQTQLIINHCVQVIIGITNMLKNSIPPLEKRQQIYKNRPVNPDWQTDHLLNFCREMEDWILELERGGQQNILYYNLGGWLPNVSEPYGWEQEPRDLTDLQPITWWPVSWWPKRFGLGKGVVWDKCYIQGILGMVLTIDMSWEEKAIEVYKRAPVLTQSFNNFLDYFSCSYNESFEIFEVLMFANLLHNEFNHSIFKIRYYIKELKSLMDQINELGGWNKHKILVYAKLWCNVNHLKWAPYHVETKQMLEQPQFTNSVVLQDENFKEICDKYLQIIDHLQILIELYNQAREKRARLLGIGHQMGYYSRNVSITMYPLNEN